ncbi:N-acylneuraminate cytidylyltransferase [Pseudomonas sp. SLBN-26]|uniref:pseudaminic acid cytidylyltransferase n=1 Tax=Pseudomonadaceae TaxID=135621 RepID=UPI0011534C83|nr:MULTISPECIES: pseudaminic acid cytidylyltransferase [Pseudomonas]MCP1615558.1 N-acylneuraminate cytidylyltransferase [Pseudomonas otitidis]TQL04829.1 N-acylneuraminate cytidylyltransferase [Pseudomonas sp. SLBN-26]
MSRVAIIPARGGSKRIPRKNIKLFQGQPMIAYPIRAALLSGLFDRVIVSTDDEEIASVARELGAEVPFMRPAALADDHAGTVAVIQHAVAELAAAGQQPELVCCLYATAPFVQADSLQAGLDLLLQHPDAHYAFTVTDFASPVQRALRLTAEGGVESLYPQFRETRSQDLEPAYHDAGQFYWGRTEAWTRGEPIHAAHSRSLVLPRFLVQDIDTPDDWHRAELMYTALLLEGDI